MENKIRIHFKCPRCGLEQNTLRICGKYTYTLNFYLSEIEYDNYMHEYLIKPKLTGRNLDEVRGATIKCSLCDYIVVEQSQGDDSYQLMVAKLAERLEQEQSTTLP